MRLQSVEGIAPIDAMPFIYYERGRGGYFWGLANHNKDIEDKRIFI